MKMISKIIKFLENIFGPGKCPSCGLRLINLSDKNWPEIRCENYNNCGYKIKLF